MKTDEQIVISNTTICKNISVFSWEDRWFLSQNILNELRTFIEAVAVKIAKQDEYTHDIYKDIARPFIQTQSKYKFIYKFHQNLQVSKSHYSQNEQNSERLMLKYYEYLLKLKKVLKEEYGFEILENLDKFPLKKDLNLQEYYEKIVEKIEEKWLRSINVHFKENYYVWKKKSFFIKNEIYYEITFSIATENTSKFDRIIAFTKKDIMPNYAIKLKINNSEINILDKSMPILIIEDYEISIRPCEIVNFGKILDEKVPKSRNTEYNELMYFLTNKWFNLVEIIDFPDQKYKEFKEFVFKKSQTRHILNILDKCRDIIKYNKPWTNILRYLIYSLNNRVIKDQLQLNKNSYLSNLRLDNWCIPFDSMPFCTSPKEHNPKIHDLLDCIDFSSREHEFLARYIQNNAENTWKTYTELEELIEFENIPNLIQVFNSNLHSSDRQQGRRLEIYKNHIYRKSNEEDIVEIIKRIKKISISWVEWYSGIVEKWIDKNPWKIDDPYKVNILKTIFEDSMVWLIYWSAWTGKTKVLEHISNLFENSTKLFLANTHPAKNNLQNRVNPKNSEFSTIAWFLNSRNYKYNILIIDECSTVSNSDILSVLRKAEFGLLILVWDIYQIESINFGNWFSIIKNFIKERSVFELENPYRTTKDELIKLWNKIRNINGTRNADDDILERILPYSHVLDDSIFNQTDTDEIILCLNYDGLYGINNINRFLQEWNPKNPIQWWAHIYKIWDPILFNESHRFAPIIYNNLKWSIIDIEISSDVIYFSIEVDKTIEENDVFFTELTLLEESKNWKSKVKFSVAKLESTDDDDENFWRNIVPFQVAYAVSIHKSQWLEYNSVKIIISDEIEEMITHNIFYTAITRARNKLSIYWSPETSKLILDNMEPRINRKDASLLKSKFNL